MEQKESRRTYVCKRSQLCAYLMERGYQPYKVAPDRDDPRYDVFLFTYSLELCEAIIDYIKARDKKKGEQV